MAITLIITKLTPVVWPHEQIGTYQGEPFILGKFAAKSDGNNFCINEQSGSKRLNMPYPQTGIPYTDIAVVNGSGSAMETFSSINALMVRLAELQYPGFDYPQAGGQTYIQAGTGVSITGSGTSSDPYIVNANGGGSGATPYNANPFYMGAGITVPNGFTGIITNLNNINADVTFTVSGTTLTITGGVENQERILINGKY